MNINPWYHYKNYVRNWVQGLLGMERRPTEISILSILLVTILHLMLSFTPGIVLYSMGINGFISFILGFILSFVIVFILLALIEVIGSLLAIKIK